MDKEKEEMKAVPFGRLVDQSKERLIGFEAIYSDGNKQTYYTVNLFEIPTVRNSASLVMLNQVGMSEDEYFEYKKQNSSGLLSISGLAGAGGIRLEIPSMWGRLNITDDVYEVGRKEVSLSLLEPFRLAYNSATIVQVYYTMPSGDVIHFEGCYDALNNRINAIGPAVLVNDQE